MIAEQLSSGAEKRRSSFCNVMSEEIIIWQCNVWRFYFYFIVKGKLLVRTFWISAFRKICVSHNFAMATMECPNPHPAEWLSDSDKNFEKIIRTIHGPPEVCLEHGATRNGIGHFRKRYRKRKCLVIRLAKSETVPVFLENLNKIRELSHPRSMPRMVKALDERIYIVYLQTRRQTASRSSGYLSLQ